MKCVYYAPVLLALAVATACTPKSKTTNNDAMGENPLFAASTLPYGAPDFIVIKNENFLPAIEQGMKAHLAQIDSIANNAETPTFENTLAAMEKSGELLQRAYGVFNLLTGANTNDTLQQVEEEVAPKMAAHMDAIYMNDKLFQRVKSIYETRESLGLDAESLKLVEYYFQKFELAGANLSPEAKEQMKKLNEEEATLTTKFGNMLLYGSRNAALLVDDKVQLEGLSEGEIAAAAQAAEKAGQAGKYLIGLRNTTQ